MDKKYTVIVTVDGEEVFSNKYLSADAALSEFQFCQTWENGAIELIHMPEEAESCVMREYEIWVDAKKVGVVHRWSTAIEEFYNVLECNRDKVVRLIAK